MSYGYEILGPWAIAGLVIAGIIALAVLILSLFFRFGDDVPDRFIEGVYKVDSEDFLQAISSLSNSPLKYGDDVKILKNGNEFFPALLAALQHAQKSITCTVYIWEDGSISTKVLDILIQKAKDGIEVRVLLDGFGCWYAPKDKFNELEKAGGKVDTFRPIRFGKISRYHKRTHRRAIVIDGTTGFIGGAAIADKWLGNAENESQWRDTMFEVTGEMAQSLQSAFAQLWAGTNGEILIGQTFYPLTQPSTKTSSNRYVSVISSPASDTEPLGKMIWLSIRCAQKKVCITNSYLVPDQYIFKALIERAEAGVDVSILIPNNSTDAKAIRHATHYHYNTLMQAGIKIYEYQPTMMHSKILSIDSKWSIIGSANMDLRSVALNEENVIGILDVKFGKKLDHMFADDLSKSKQINQDKWEKRNIFKRFLEIFFVRFMKQY